MTTENDCVPPPFLLLLPCLLGLRGVSLSLRLFGCVALLDRELVRRLVRVLPVVATVAAGGCLFARALGREDAGERLFVVTVAAGGCLFALGPSALLPFDRLRHERLLRERRERENAVFST